MLDLLLALCPSFLHVFFRRLRGAKIGKNTRLRFGTLIRAKHVEIGDRVTVGPFTLLSANSLEIGDDSQINALSVCRAGEVRLGRYVHVASASVIYGPLTKRSRIAVGDHSLFGPFCWLEPGEGIEIGKHVGIGGHVRIFTHGVWADYLRGGPVTYGPVILQDDAWLAWNAFVLPNVVIGQNAMIGAGAVVSKSVPPNALAAGMLARVVDANVMTNLNDAEKVDRARRILEDYPRFRTIPGATKEAQSTDSRLEFGPTIAIDSDTGLREGDLLFLVARLLSTEEHSLALRRGVSILDHSARTIYLASKEPYLIDFISFVRRYGIRLYVR